MSQETKAKEEVQNEDERVDEHLDDVEDGCGCTEIWEHLSDQREADDD